MLEKHELFADNNNDFNMFFRAIHTSMNNDVIPTNAQYLLNKTY
jgi:hypothetical protein